MSKNPYEESAFVRFARGKGFYAVLAVFLIGAGVTGACLLTESDPVKEKEPNTVQLQKREDYRPDTPKPEEVLFPPKKEEKTPPVEKVKEEPKKEVTEAPKEEIAVAKKEFKGTMPCKGEITSPFSKGELVKDETMGDWRTHNGIDITCPEGSEVVAFASGKVMDVRSDSLWGTVVEIQHSGAVITKYCGLNENVNVVKGDTVKMGDAIGKLGIIPCEGAKEPHLHFEMTEKGKLKDPAEFIE